MENTATADSDESGPATGDETIAAIGTPVLVLEKSADKATYSSVGEIITYTLVATNIGNVTLFGVTISDPKLPTLICTQPVTLTPGASLTCTGTYTITQADLDAG